ncbi:2-acyl-glycerophospho-ethanolamine acyltransferase [Zhengella mangrovi]|uniref:2-acyl-glycerophospho-ethanolamine acyltransferase n=1 Tax=Zhengella mangrovi TaxID=1982044 RepID=A0A2G1QRW2_9HYPH|nr:AMP-binding protein [Zhengella mangrovi]PHP68263.1 2-acyl-glycerophospho-ethanolamine acyltransferase [Zhengella mangrovi]
MALAGMVLAIAVVAYAIAVLVQWLGGTGSLAQAFWVMPFKLIWRLDDSRLAVATGAPAPVVYAVLHQSRIDPAIMLATLPDDTLHILDQDTAQAGWMEPYRALARTIVFKAEHVFVSRRLVRHLKGNGRLAVYLPPAIEPDRKTLRLYRAVARIALRSGASVVPVVIDGARHLPSSLIAAEQAPRHRLQPLAIHALPPMTMEQLMARGPLGTTTATNAFFDRIADARFVANAATSSTLYDSMVAAVRRFGPNGQALSDPLTGSLTRKRVMVGARVLARRFIRLAKPGKPVGLMLPNANGVAVAFFAIQGTGRPAAMINYTAGPANVASAIRAAGIGTVISSKAFVEKADLGAVVEAIHAAGAQIAWLEDIRDSITWPEKLLGAVCWARPPVRAQADDPAVILFTSGSEGTPKGVVLSHRNILANVAQIAARIDFSPADRLFNVLPVFHSFGLTGGTILPMLGGVDLFLYPSPLHYKLIPQAVAKVKPTIMFGTDTFLNGYARTARDSDFASLRMVVAGAEAVKPETERVWRERFGAQVLEGFGMTEAAPVVAVNSHTHGRLSTVGRLLPGIEARLEPVDGIPVGGRLWLKGPNLMQGYLTAKRPGELQPLADGWHDSGDIVAIDRDGFVAVKGRAKRFAKIAGEMVSLGAVEMLVQSLWPEERHAAVSVPDKRKGERIVLVTTATQADAEKLREFGRHAGAADLMVPNDIVKVGDIPVLGSGKTDYAGARAIALEKLGLDEKPKDGA